MALGKRRDPDGWTWAMIRADRSRLLQVALGIGLALIGLLGLGPPNPARAQSDFQAQVISPSRDQPVWGTVDIVGIATHPNFAKYDVAILDAQDFTKEWRWLVQGRPVRADAPTVLATWNTRLFPDGEYVILVRVWDQGGGHRDFLFPGYRVANAQPTPTPTEAVAPTIEPEPTGPFVMTPTVQIELPPTATPGPTSTPIPGGVPTSARDGLGLEALLEAFFAGVRWTFILFGIWGSILILRWGWRRWRR
ncbi:hypothetical protein [Thermoflexus sp.]|uniref:hypothetical protein n=1 Tax=Thermoflexus sp. TaxID=1969742 RepID=UPI0025F186E0|nr:hypothetical protein [Thermoflexus sp.]MDW8180499.1 hypothetical protein [Anaerolineae bacterium]MCS6962750.1 hypothetical protein [Thermoflexus sp.]MCS7351046.1 hypothetical protein [Thermoflexus sp.]MCX7690534.1 hypothetical protein [Thermoflexus sp.]MDW8183986.1 hypothetical protein [Anaerolineae bacterium]